MKLEWSDYVRLWWPLIAYLAFAILGGLCVACYRAGQNSLLTAALKSAKEVKVEVHA